MIRLVVDEYPRTQAECPFAAQENRHGYYFCKLGNHEREKCRPGRCPKLVTMEDRVSPGNETSDPRKDLTDPLGDT